MNIQRYIEPRLILLMASPFLLFSLSDLFDNEGRQHGALFSSGPPTLLI